MEPKGVHDAVSRGTLEVIPIDTLDDESMVIDTTDATEKKKSYDLGCASNYIRSAYRDKCFQSKDNKNYFLTPPLSPNEKMLN